MPDITVCIPSIPPRGVHLQRALRSVHRQTRPPVTIAVCVDEKRRGAAETRQKALDTVSTEFVAFLDDDDEFLPRHLELLHNIITATGADVVYPWFEVIGGTDPFPGRYGKEFDADLLRKTQYVPVTVLARTEAIREAGGFRAEPNELGWQNEDWRLWKAMLSRGATFVHLPRRTWSWHHWLGVEGRNTSGNPANW